MPKNIHAFQDGFDEFVFMNSSSRVHWTFGTTRCNKRLPHYFRLQVYYDDIPIATQLDPASLHII